MSRRRRWVSDLSDTGLLANDRVRAAFDREALAQVCERAEGDFASAYDMTVTTVDHYRGQEPGDFYAYLDNGSNILAVAHLDTVGLAHQRTARFLDTEGGPVVYSRALDDRLGAYTILHLLPALGVNVDVLLTVGEENGRSTAAYFEPPADKEYDWIIEFDRGGTDVVMYQYEDPDTIALVEQAGARVDFGSFSDIAYLEHLGVKAFNWGIGYRDYHGPRAHAYLDDTYLMVAQFLRFHQANSTRYLPHEPDALIIDGAGQFDSDDLWSASEWPSERDYVTDLWDQLGLDRRRL